jgi:hypothetical protein
MKKLFTHKTLIRSAFLTVLFEGITAFCRFGLDLESTRDTASTVGLITLGLRIHHSYLGLLLVAIAFWGLKTKRTSPSGCWQSASHSFAAMPFTILVSCGLSPGPRNSICSIPTVANIHFVYEYSLL